MRESHALFLILVIIGLALSGVSHSYAQSISGDKDFEALCKDKTVHVPKGGSAPQDKVEGGKPWVESKQGKEMMARLITARVAKNQEEARKMLTEKYGWCDPQQKKNCGKVWYIDADGSKKPACDDRCQPVCDSMRPASRPPTDASASGAGEPKSTLGMFAEKGRKMFDSLIGKEDLFEDRPLMNDPSISDAFKTPPGIEPAPSDSVPEGNTPGDTFGDALRKMIDDQAGWEANHPANRQAPMGKAELGEDLVFRDSVTGKEIPFEAYEVYGIGNKPDIAAIQNPLSDYETNPAWDPGGLSADTFGEPGVQAKGPGLDGSPKGIRKITAYGPGGGGIEAGWETSRPNLEGLVNRNGDPIPRTLMDVVNGTSQYVSLAGKVSDYGSLYNMGPVTFTGRDGVTYTGDKALAERGLATYSPHLENVIGYAHDLCPECPRGGFDVAVDDFRSWRGRRSTTAFLASNPVRASYTWQYLGGPSLARQIVNQAAASAPVTPFGAGAYSLARYIAGVRRR